MNSFNQGKIWYTVRNILQKGLLANEEFFRDGRELRSLLLDEINHTINPYSPVKKFVAVARRRQELSLMTPRPEKLR
jgi:hypothetical protein